MTNKLTKTQKNEDIIAMLKGEVAKNGTTLQEAIEHLEHENELIAKKADSSKAKKAEGKAANGEIKQIVFETLKGNAEGMTATEIMVMCSLKSSQMATRFLQELVKEGSATWEKVKGKSIYKAC